MREKLEKLIGYKFCSGLGRVTFVPHKAAVSGKGFNRWITKISVNTRPTTWLIFHAGALVINPDNLMYPVANRTITAIHAPEGRVDKILLDCTAHLRIISRFELQYMRGDRIMACKCTQEVDCEECARLEALGDRFIETNGAMGLGHLLKGQEVKQDIALNRIPSNPFIHPKQNKKPERNET